MSVARILPTAALVGVAALIVTPLAVAWRMMGDGPEKSGGTTKKSQAPAKTGKAVTLAGFDGERAYQYLVEQCKIGPRISGTEGNRKLRQRLAEHFKEFGAEVRTQLFEVEHPLTGAPVEMENVVAAWHSERKRRVVLGAHFDTRPRPDKETNPRKKAEPFLGANDGASGIAVLMELAQLMPKLQTTVGVDFVAFDGEELVYDERGEYFLGSKHFADEYRREAGRGGRYVGGIVIDMVGDKSLDIFPDAEGDRQCPQLRQEVWAIAKRLKATGFKTGRYYDVRDDHLSLLDAGIPAIDIIDFDYPHWHRVGDTADKCSAASLVQVGGVLAEWLRGQ